MGEARVAWHDVNPHGPAFSRYVKPCFSKITCAVAERSSLK